MALLMTRACVAVMSPLAKAAAVAGNCSSLRPVDTITVASAGSSRQLPISQPFIDTAPSRR